MILTHKGVSRRCDICNEFVGVDTGPQSVVGMQNVNMVSLIKFEYIMYVFETSAARNLVALNNDRISVFNLL